MSNDYNNSVFVWYFVDIHDNLMLSLYIYIIGSRQQTRLPTRCNGPASNTHTHTHARTHARTHAHTHSMLSRVCQATSVMNWACNINVMCQPDERTRVISTHQLDMLCCSWEQVQLCQDMISYDSTLTPNITYSYRIYMT